MNCIRKTIDGVKRLGVCYCGYNLTSIEFKKEIKVSNIIICPNCGMRWVEFLSE